MREYVRPKMQKHAENMHNAVVAAVDDDADEKSKDGERVKEWKK